MAEADELNNPILVAVWPGMGGVSITAGGYLVETLGAELIGELPTQDLFELQQVDVENGVATPARTPRCMFFEWRHPQDGPDLLIFLGEAQPPRGGYALCQHLVDYAKQRGAKRFFTFAAMATQLHPSSRPRVFGVATDEHLVNGLREFDVEILTSGQISGLNGVMLAAGASSDLPGTCLMGELPFFAARVPNPRASLAILEVFSSLTKIDIELGDLRVQAQKAEPGLLQLLEQMQTAARERAESEGEEEFSLPEFTVEEDQEATAEVIEEPAIDDATRRRIETLFEQSREDRSRSFQLKELLDRHGVFDRYEDRFLDLFRKAE
jgi:proteasome assembly chaperone (PAC2) family protein